MNKPNKPTHGLWKGRSLLQCAVTFASVIFLVPGCALIHRNHGPSSGTPAPGAQPDKVLLQNALGEFKHGRYDEGRLLLQSLMNTYPDSEYLSQAKLAIADSYYKQGGISGLTEAEAEYKDFITFFPTAPEAPMSEYRAGMCHFRLIGKADRDQTEAKEAETEFKQFLLKYPTSPLMPEVKGRLREVQQVLADGDYEIAMFYYERQAWPAAESRFREIVDNYPNFSRGDQIFWRLADTLNHLNRNREAVPYYDRLVMEFPLSPLVKNAKQQLAAMHEPIPKPTEAMLARAEADAAHREHPGLLHKTLGGLSSGPDYSQTLRGPVVLGTPYQIQMQIAKLNGTVTPAAHAPARQNGVTVQTANEASLNSGKPIDPAPANPANANKDSGTAANSSNKASQPQQKLANQNANSASSGTPSPPQKKSGKLHFLKKIIP